ncbi:MAG TPA: histidine phosphatase family protein [Bacteroidia bacterium]|jgi:phosphohistidine phosphatase|nr:histidine phosphatase family protein [Bacteroidia bacterium]
MKELVLVRHAKSDWANESVKDIDRSLSERGFADAYSLSNWFKEEMGLPDAMVSSPATRAIGTAFIFARTFEMKEKDVLIEDSLYESDVRSYLKVISQTDKKINRLMLFGHNPMMTELSNEINKSLYFDNVPTCGIVKIGFEFSDWKEILNKQDGKLLISKFPKSFKK